jgi:potassium/hydrogen antiporter
VLLPHQLMPATSFNRASLSCDRRYRSLASRARVASAEVGEDQIILVAGALLAAALGASVLAERAHLPVLLLFIAVGMAVGSDGTGWVVFNNYEAAQQVGSVALALILFEGGLSAGLARMRPVLGAAFRLGILGTAITALLGGMAAAFLFGLRPVYGLLLGSILASTDTAAVFGLLRGSPLRKRIGRTLEAEAGLNDPVAILLVLGFVRWIQRPDYGVADMVILFVRQLGIGALSGMLVGAGAVEALKRVRLVPSGLYPVASLAVAALAFGGAEVFGGSGFLAVYLAGLALGSPSVPDGRALRVFHSGVSWLAQLTLFLMLGLLVNPAQLGSVAADSIVLATVILVVARPAAVMLATVSENFSVNERLLLAWAGLRGAVPVVLATYAVTAGVPQAQRFFEIAFFTVVLSTLVQGTTFEPLARKLGLLERPSRSRDERTRLGGPIPPLVRQLWSVRHDDPAEPRQVDGTNVSRRLATRGGVAGALVELDDGRFAVTGPSMAAGSVRQIDRYALRRLDAAGDREEARWWKTVRQALDGAAAMS